MTDKDLYDGLKTRDPKAFQWIYDQMFNKVQAMITNNSGSSDDAQDLFQEALTALWINVKVDKYKLHSGAKLSTYFYQLCKNKWISQLRRKKIKTTDWKDELGNKEAIIDNHDEERILKVEQAMKRLGSSCQELLERYYYRKESLKVIAVHLGYTEKTTKNNKYRCMHKLKTILSSQSDVL